MPISECRWVANAFSSVPVPATEFGRKTLPAGRLRGTLLAKVKVGNCSFAASSVNFPKLSVWMPPDNPPPYREVEVHWAE
jgi:hypothetical protein